MRIWGLGITAFVVSALATLAAPALASNVIYPATYTGTAATGGTIELDVSADGTQVIRLALNKVPMPPCGTITGQTGRKASIINDSFANNEGIMHFNGVFLAARQAQGMISYHGKTTGCDSEEVAWTATAPPPPIIESPPPTTPSTPPPMATPAPPPPPDELPPRTKIKSGPSGTTPKEKATFRFFATEADSTFRCKLDGRAWRSCTSPRAYGDLKEGRHVFEVQAMDAAGNVDLTPAKRIWHIKGTPANPPVGPDKVQGHVPW